MTAMETVHYEQGKALLIQHTHTHRGLHSSVMDVQDSQLTEWAIHSQ